MEELLDFSRIERSTLNFVMEDVDVNDLLDEVIQIFDKRSKIEGISIILNNELQDSGIKGDFNRLKQVLINIMDNGFKFNREGGYIEVLAYNESVYVVIEIEDSGIGIKEGDLKKVKEKFFKGNQNIKGSGLGLAISNEIIKLHGGILDIKSSGNNGTKVILKLIRL